MQRLVLVLLTAVALAITGATAHAQSVTTVELDILDQDDNPIPDVIVQLEYKGHVAQKYKGKTNKKGRFTYVRVYVGPYTVRLSKEGYPDVELPNFMIRDRGQFENATQLKLKRKPALPPAGSAPPSAATLDEMRTAIQQSINAAMQLVAAGKYDEAEAAYLKLVEVVPTSLDAHYNLGFLYKRKGALDQAEAEFRRAIECDPKQGEPYNALGVLFVERGRIPEALATLEAGVAAGATDARLHLSLGIMHVTAGRSDAARQALLRSAELDPTAAEPHFHLASLAVSHNDVPTGIAEIEKFLALSPADDPKVETAKGLLAALRPAPKK